MKTVKEIKEIFSNFPEDTLFEVKYLNNSVDEYISIEHIIQDLL